MIDISNRDDGLRARPKGYQVQYLKRKAAGRCTTTGCSREAAVEHTKCHAHLQALSKQHRQRYRSRTRAGLCIYCGERPQFWGIRCVICRQKFSRDLLPAGARRALRSYLEAEKQRESEHAEVEARFAARKFLLTHNLTRVQARALRLFVGDDNGSWRTYEDVASLMHVSKQRVHHLLLASRTAWEPALQVVNRKGWREPPRNQRAPLTRRQKAYEKRRAAGQCAYGPCSSPAAFSQVYCKTHLKAMAESAAERKRKRLAQGLCVVCGKRPLFWSRKCIICRQVYAREPLPNGAKRAVRSYFDAEVQSAKEKIQKQARDAAAHLIESDQIKGKRAIALRLYAGIEDDKWRTYAEVAKIMQLSVERVRQLLLPAKTALEFSLRGGVPWRAIDRQNQHPKDYRTRNFNRWLTHF